jgi:hypothetical protein
VGIAGRFDVGVWYEYRRMGVWINQYDVFYGVVVDGVRLDPPTGPFRRTAPWPAF